jgi:hypothetical protein
MQFADRTGSDGYWPQEGHKRRQLNRNFSYRPTVKREQHSRQFWLLKSITAGLLLFLLLRINNSLFGMKWK